MLLLAKFASFIIKYLYTVFIIIFPISRVQVGEKSLKTDEKSDSDEDGHIGYKEKPELSFGFKFQTYEEFSKSDGFMQQHLSLDDSDGNRDVKVESHLQVLLEHKHPSSFKSHSDEGLISFSPLSHKIDFHDNDSNELEISGAWNVEDSSEIEKYGAGDLQYNNQLEKSDSWDVEDSKLLAISDVEDANLLDKSDSRDLEDSNVLEMLWDHQELIKQLKMELRKVKDTGLPTILEEEEEEYNPKCPNILTKNLMPWKIDEENITSQLHMFYKSYRERMRKLDILNYQKMYAIGFHVKDPLQTTSRNRHPGSLFFKSLRVFKGGKIEDDPIVKLASELDGDFEAVYVGQVCLSWEFLHWQYDKAIKLWESDMHSIHRYNEVAGEFQQFEVLIQRFIEDEPFQGPRVQNYLKTRCVLRNLLQVPMIKGTIEDGSKSRKDGRKQGDHVIGRDKLVQTMEDCIRILWRFIRADKDLSRLCVKRQNVIQNPSDSGLFYHIQTSLQKKERKLKKLMRTKNCILKRFQHNEDDSQQVLYFFCQVDMRLVSTVLNMSRITTDQLIWCQNKLSMINFVNRKIRVEPSPLLFPC